MKKIVTKIELPDFLATAIENTVTEAIQNAANKQALSNQYHIYMSKAEAAKYLNIASNTLDLWISTTDIPYRRVGKTYRFNRNELDKFMTSTNNRNK